MNWLLCQMLLDYAIVPFLAGSFSDVFKIWSNLSFYGTAVVIAVLVCTRGSKLLRSPELSKEKISVKISGSKSPAERLTLVEENFNLLVKKSRKSWPSVLMKRTRIEM